MAKVSSAVTCSRKCLDELKRKGIYKRKRYEIEYKKCKWCGLYFEIWKCRLKRKNGFNNIGSYCSAKCRANYNKRIGDKNNRWNGGISTEHEKIRGLPEFREWRKNIFKRDNYTCQICNNAKIRQLNAHHIKSFSKHPELRFNIANGLTVCVPCHKTIHRGIVCQKSNIEIQGEKVSLA